MGLVEVGDAVEGLPAREADELLEVIQASCSNTQLVVHANATGHPYIFLSKAGSNANITDVRVVEGFVTQEWRKALRATLTEADGDVDLWLVHLASSKERHLPISVRKQTLSYLETRRPTVIAGDINTSQFLLRDWMRGRGAAFSPSLASSGVSPPLHGDFTIATNMLMWQMPHQCGKSFQDAGMHRLDRVSDNHDMVCVGLSGLDAQRGRQGPKKKRKSNAEEVRGSSSSVIAALAVAGPSREGDSDAAELAGGEEAVAASSGQAELPTESPQRPAKAFPEDSSPADAAELGDAKDSLARSDDEASSPEECSMADAAEVGDATDPMDDLHLSSEESSRLRGLALQHISQTGQVLLQAAEDVVAWSASSDEERVPPSPDRTPELPGQRPGLVVDGQPLSEDFLAAMQDLLWPVQVDERDRPADLLSYESILSPTVRMAPREATIRVAALILALREVAWDHRVAEAQATATISGPPNPDAPLTRGEVRAVLKFWRNKFDEQALTQQQAERDRRDGYTRDQMRKRMRSRWYTYQSRALGNRKLGMALLTMGFEVDLKKLATVYAQTTADGDASSLPSSDLRQRTLAMRSWYRWGRQLYRSVESNEAWNSLGPIAKNAWRWYSKGWSGEEADRLTKKYGHGMLRTGRVRGTFLGQEAKGSVVDRMRPEFL